MMVLDLAHFFSLQVVNDLIYNPGAIMRRKRTPTKFFMMKLLNYFDTSVDIPNSIVSLTAKLNVGKIVRP